MFGNNFHIICSSIEVFLVPSLIPMHPGIGIQNVYVQSCVDICHSHIIILVSKIRQSYQDISIVERFKTTSMENGDIVVLNEN